MSESGSVTEPVSAGQLSPDGRFRWDGGRWVYATAVPVAQAIVAPKNAGLAVVASFFFPGLGTIMNGEGGKGAAMLISDFVLWFLFLLTFWFVLGFIFVPFMLGLWIWAIYDAYEGARKWNARHGIVS
jgi:TM2 domain-containing membrane protein YozV